MKKVLIVLFCSICIVACANIVSVKAETYSGSCSNNIMWNLDTDTGTLSISGSGSMPNYTSSKSAPWHIYRYYIKTIIINYGIRNIGDYAFDYCEKVENITISNSVESIGRYAFNNCTSLAEITIPSSVTGIGSYAFMYCSKLKGVYISDLNAWCNISFNDESANPLYYAKNLYVNDELVTELVIPDGVTSICDSAFYYCSSLTSVIIPDSVTSIGESSFEYCCNLTKATLGSGITTIGVGAFKWCTHLTNITIPNSVNEIGAFAFYYCVSLTGVNVNDLEGWCNITFGNETANPLYYAKNLYINNEFVTEFVLPNNLTTIKSYSFFNCNNLNNVIIPASVTSIEKYAFMSCSNLTDVYYKSDENTWSKILIYTGNESLANANIKFHITRTYTFVTNGGTAVESIKEEILEEPITIRPGYIFIGWYDNAEFYGSPIVFPYSGESTTLYAYWCFDPDYTINSITLRDISTNNEIDIIPDKSFVVEINVTNVKSEDINIIIIAVYDDNGILIDMDFVYADLKIGESITFGSLISNSNGKIHSIKAFVRPKINSLVPLAESKEITK